MSFQHPGNMIQLAHQRQHAYREDAELRRQVMAASVDAGEAATARAETQRRFTGAGVVGHVRSLWQGVLRGAASRSARAGHWTSG